MSTETLIPYPSTLHLPFSQSVQRDDKVIRDTSHLHGVPCVVTTKQDGENTNMYSTAIHARSVDSRHHPSRDWVKAFHARIAHMIPTGWRICGENLFARHSLVYTDLPSYFMGFSAWDENNNALSWDDTVDFFKELSIVPVPVIARIPFDLKELEKLAKSIDTTVDEGFVVRPEASFHYDDFSRMVTKWVRPNHVQTDDHWMHSAIVPNGLSKTKAPA